MGIILIIDDGAHHVPALDRVPRVHEFVRYDSKNYTVTNVIYNLDIEEITVYLIKS